MINFDNNLIIVKGEDKTSDIIKWEYRDGNILITFSSGGQTYKYNSCNVEFYKDPKELDPQCYRININNKLLTEIVRIQQFKHHIRVRFEKGKYQTLAISDIEIVKSALADHKAKDVFKYLKNISQVDNLKGEDGLSILAKRFDKIDYVPPNSIFSDYLKEKLRKNINCVDQTQLYPFGFNASQKEAVDNALNNRLSIIEGPPGTGKTQTILNIIANVVMRGQSVAVVSSNNSATENVEEKLNKYGVGFISAFLGSSKNKEKFILKQKELPLFDSWYLNDEEYQDINTKLISLYSALEIMLSNKNELAKLRLEYDSTELEQQHFMTYYEETELNDIKPKSIGTLKSYALLNIIAQTEIRMESKLPTTFFQKIVSFFRFGIYNYSFYKNSPERIVAVCQKLFYDAKINELRNKIDNLEKSLDNFDFDSKMNEYSDLSLKIFKDKLAKKYKMQNRNTYSDEDLWKRSEDFIKDYPVILSTTHSLRSSLNSEFVYDYVIVDEASQVSVTTGALAFSCAKNAVIVGDLMQLPNVVDGEMKKRTDAIWLSYDISEAYRYSDHSLLLSVTKLFQNVPKCILREHYRCHPKIINFCNQKYYNNRLIILTNDEGGKSPLLAYQTAPGNHARDFINQRQIDVIKNEIIPQQNLDLNSHSIGIVTPYRNQADKLQLEFEGTKVKADTVDKFQGQERDVIILSTVDNDISDFADDDHRLNVAISRAAQQLIVVTSGNKPSRETGIGDLVKYIRYNNMEIINSEIYSVFDLLYKQYFDVRRREIEKLKLVSEFDSENIMYALIIDTLNNVSFNKYDVLLHIPLKMIIRDLSKIDNDREINFIMNQNTHVDFLIYDKISHQPVLIIEVDGVSFHKEGSKQAERDRLKDSILDKYGLPIERFRTDGSNEKQRLHSALEKLTS